jgi:hypothetical protein
MAFIAQEEVPYRDPVKLGDTTEVLTYKEPVI